MSVPTLLRRRRRLQPLAAGTHSPQVRAALPWLLASLGLTMTTLVGQVPIWTLIVFAGCAGWRQWLERRGGALPSMAWRLAVFLPSVAGVFLVYGTHPGAQGMLALLATLLSLKMLELRSPRDLIIVALLGYFMVLSAFFYDQSLALSLYLCVAVLLNTVALIRCHGGSRPLWSTLRLALGMGLQALPLVVLLFVIFPRLQGTFFRRLGGATTGLTGMNEHLEPGSFNSLVQSEQPVFRVKIVGGEGPALRYLYWRGLVLDTCEKALSWRASESWPVPLPRRNGPPAAAVGRIEQFITLLPHGRNWLFALDRPVDIAPSSTLLPQLTTNNTVRSQRPIISKVIYTVYSQFSAASPRPLDDPRRAFLTQLPPDLSPRVMELVDGWKKRAKSPEDIIRSARNFFREGGFVYTLNPGALPSQNALDHFLFKSRRGFCEHYAAAFSTLMRAAGIPSRIVIGYQGGEFNHWNGYYNVRQSDAHAWSEVWIDGKGWQREDPTAVVAPERLSFGADSYAALSAFGDLSAQSRLEQLSRLSGQGGWRGLARNVLLAWDSVDQQWNVMVLGYDQEQQSDFLQRAGLGGLDWLGAITLSMAGIFALLALGAVFMRSFGGERAAVPKDPARRLYQRFCERAAAAAQPLRRAEAEGPLDFAARAREALPDCAEQIGAITDLYVASRYAPAGPGHAETLADLRRAVTAFRPAKRIG
jgi:transglutaminase-like putative cysteine protease